MPEPPSVFIPQWAWQPNDALADPYSRLLATVTINGCPMHLEAWQVTVDEGVQQAVAVEDDGDFDRFYEAVHADGHFQTVRMHDRDYVLVASPYC